MSASYSPTSPSSPSSFRLQGQVAVLTGASSGIGAAIAHALFREGASVCMGARRLEKLREVAASAEQQNANCPGKTICQTCNVTHRQDVMSLVETAERELGPVDIMINCAGVMYMTNMTNVLQDQWEETVDVNCKGVLNGFGAVIPKMVARGKGRIINISSHTGIRQFQTLAVYCASKSFVEVLSEVTRRELVGTGVTIATICPGDVKGTELVMKNSDPEAAKRLGVTIGAPVGEGFSREQVLDMEDVADSVIYVLTAPPHVAVNTIMIEPRDQE